VIDKAQGLGGLTGLSLPAIRGDRDAVQIYDRRLDEELTVSLNDADLSRPGPCSSLFNAGLT
jgi:hypothetical protein